MKKPKQSQRIWRWSAAFCLLLSTLPSLAAVHKSEAWARAQFETAEKMHTALQGRAPEDRSRRDYQKVIDAYRRVYFGAPSSSKADPSLAAEAGLMEEMGRRFEDEEILRKAIRDYEFLRREYPGSRARVEALFAIGQIYRDDLGEPARAKSAFEELLRKYPRSRLADDARQALAEERPAASKRKPEEQAPEVKHKGRKIAGGNDEASAASAGAAKVGDNQQARNSEKGQALALITGIHHFSLPDSTRVTINLRKAGAFQTDLQQSLKFRAQHLSHPDRIYFDLAEAKLVRRLNGKSLEVDDPLLKRIRIAQFKEGRTRVVLEVEEQSAYDASLADNPPRLVINIRKKASGKDSSDEKSASLQPVMKVRSHVDPPPSDLPVRGLQRAGLAATGTIEAAQPFIGPVAVATDPVPPAAKKAAPPVEKKIVEPDDDGDDATASSVPAKVRKSPMTQAVERSQVRASRSIHEAQPTANGNRSLIRALGLKIGKIVIDPGHGGHDTGTIGPNGLTEKDLVLEVSLRLGKLLESRLGAEVDYTRDDDTFVPLETRTAIANHDQADLFVSIHANSSHDPDARGVETYYLNFTSSRDALEVAARENAVSDQSIYELQDLVKKIALKEKIEESREFATNVQSALLSGLSVKNPGLRDRGVKRAPFIVLIGANMPSILAEVSFVSNPSDEVKLKTAEYRQRIAEALYRGIAKYVSGLSGVRVASKLEKSSDQ